jgi:hypothetical protein
MPGKSISIVKIETHLEAETNLLNLSLRTAIPMQPESSNIPTRDSDQISEPEVHHRVIAGPSTRKQEQGETNKPPDVSRSSEAEGKSQGPGVAKEAKDVIFASVNDGRER